MPVTDILVLIGEYDDAIYLNGHHVTDALVVRISDIEDTETEEELMAEYETAPKWMKNAIIEMWESTRE